MSQLPTLFQVRDPINNLMGKLVGSYTLLNGAYEDNTPVAPLQSFDKTQPTFGDLFQIFKFLQTDDTPPEVKAGIIDEKKADIGNTYITHRHIQLGRKNDPKWQAKSIYNAFSQHVVNKITTVMRQTFADIGKGFTSTGENALREQMEVADELFPHESKILLISNGLLQYMNGIYGKMWTTDKKYYLYTNVDRDISKAINLESYGFLLLTQTWIKVSLEHGYEYTIERIPHYWSINAAYKAVPKVHVNVHILKKSSLPVEKLSGRFVEL